MGANIKVPRPEPQTAMPVAKAGRKILIEKLYL